MAEPTERVFVPLNVVLYAPSDGVVDESCDADFAELWHHDETHPDGFRIVCAIDIKTGSIISPHSNLWSA